MRGYISDHINLLYIINFDTALNKVLVFMKVEFAIDYSSIIQTTTTNATNWSTIWTPCIILSLLSRSCWKFRVQRTSRRHRSCSNNSWGVQKMWVKEAWVVTLIICGSGMNTGFVVTSHLMIFHTVLTPLIVLCANILCLLLMLIYYLPFNGFRSSSKLKGSQRTPVMLSKRWT